jgi:hypothetical protein
MANLTVTDELVAQRDVFGNTLVELIDDAPSTSWRWALPSRT